MGDDIGDDWADGNSSNEDECCIEIVDMLPSGVDVGAVDGVVGGGVGGSDEDDS